jgi:hypothetical protein
VQWSVVHVGRHFLSSPEVKKEIKIFKYNLSTQKLHHIIRSILNCPEELTPPEIEVSLPVILKTSFKLLIFNALDLLYY